MNLKEITIFSDLNDAELSKVERIIEEKEYEERDIIIAEDDAGDKMCVILKGIVEVKKQIQQDNSSEQAITLARLAPPEAFGELSIFDDVPRSATVEALTKTRVIIIDKKDLESLVDSEPKIGVKILKSIIRKTAKRLIKANNTICDFARNTFHI